MAYRYGLILCLLMVGCATRPYQPIGSFNTYGPMSNQDIELYANKLTMADCPMIDQHVEFAENQLRMRGIFNRSPEMLNENDRLFNTSAKKIIWGLRIGCNNPKRYAQK